MTREGTIGAATLLAIAAVVGVSLQSGPKPEGTGSDKAQQTAAIKRSKPPKSKTATHAINSGCSNLEEQLEQFLEIKELEPPGQCYEPGDAPADTPQPDLTAKTSQLKFVIALLPDPAHTHLPVVFDQFAVAMQEGAQDEKFDFDSSWLPWDEEGTPYALLADQKVSDLEKDLTENEPGIILFRNTHAALAHNYREGLVVFVVGEDATHGIHREQFRNALSWIADLSPRTATRMEPLAILGPTFSGSFPSLYELLSDSGVAKQLDLRDGRELAIYSGSVSGNQAAEAFRDAFKSSPDAVDETKVALHSFVQNDDEILQRFCNYLIKEQPEFDVQRLAIVSEDETAYGSSGVERPEKNDTDCYSKALKLYFPRDISALRSAYQNKALFNVGTSAQSADTQRRSLPTDLTDPSGKVHDSIASYGGNQTPLTQEASLMGIVTSLREHGARYILLRSSNTLDQLFLTNFLRRGYPDGRIVIFGSDLMFIRERGTTGLGGAMTLSTYPLFPLEREWTEHQSLVAADRVFSGDTIEGTYVAFRLLLNDKSLNEGKTGEDRCQVRNKDANKIFVPSIACAGAPPIPDYSAPFWALPDQCGEMAPNSEGIANVGDGCPYPEPATWVSVIAANQFWPMAALTHQTPNSLAPDPRKVQRLPQREREPGGRPQMPLGMKVFLLLLVGFSLFHAGCCWFGSYTAKPAFRAHFASTGDWRHTALIFCGSCCVAFLAIVTGWGCGVFSVPASGLAYPWYAFTCVLLACLLAGGAILANNRTSWKLAQDVSSSAELPRMTKKDFTRWNYLAPVLFVVVMVIFYLSVVLAVDLTLLPENRVLTYWRAMHLTSGVSPIVPILLVLGAMYLSFWFTLHGLALFGPDRPCLPPKERLALKDGGGKSRDFLRMFSQEDAAAGIEHAAIPLNGKIAPVGICLFLVFLGGARVIAGSMPVRSLGARSYAILFLVCLDACCTLAIVEAWRLCQVWDELRRLLAFLDRLPLRRTLAALRGFSWGGVWRMSGNVLEVRYKVISRQMECMNHTIASLQEFAKKSPNRFEVQNSLKVLTDMHEAGITFAGWYSEHYAASRAGDLSSFSEFQASISSASGTLLAKLLVPAWREEEASLAVASPKDEKDDDATPSHLPRAKEKHIQNAEEFVCLNYLAFIQNVLGRLRTMAVTIMLLLLVAIVATSTYPFDPRQALSGVLIVLFVMVGAVVVNVYADMHRDATLSHVTNTKPGELGPEFWFKIIGFGLAPLIGLLARVFPGITDFVFSYLQPGIASLK